MDVPDVPEGRDTNSDAGECNREVSGCQGHCGKVLNFDKEVK
jgi:hypothetical protein